MKRYIKPVTSFEGMEMESHLLASSAGSDDYKDYPIRFGGTTTNPD